MTDSAASPSVPGPQRVLVTASIVVPGDAAMPMERIEAFVALAFKDGGCLPVWVAAEPVEDTHGD